MHALKSRCCLGCFIPDPCYMQPSQPLTSSSEVDPLDLSLPHTYLYNTLSTNTSWLFLQCISFPQHSLENVCACAHGTAASGHACPKDGASKCIACNPKFMFNETDASCSPHTDCADLGMVETKPGTQLTDVECSENFCKCVF